MKWIPLLIVIPLISWGVMFGTLLFIDGTFEEVCFHNGFGMWLASLITAYGFYLYRII
jgi:hypothetical protein